MSLIKRLYIFVLICISGIATSNLYSQSSGLRFFGQEHQVTERTSLELFPQKPLKTTKQFSIQFDLSLQKNYYSYFGYIFRMISSDGTNIDLVYVNTSDGLHTINLIIGDDKLLLSIPIPVDYFNKWKPINIDFDIINNSYTLHVGEYHIEKKGEILPDNNELEIYFGLNHHKSIETIDLPNMKIRNIILSQNHKKTHHWLLDNSEGNISEDIISHKKAIVTNPLWLHQNHYKWQLSHNFKTNTYAQICFNQKENRFFVVSSDSLTSFLADAKEDYNKISFGRTISYIPGDQIIYDSINNIILRYSVDQKLISKYNFESNTWSNEFPKVRALTEYWQHNKYIRPSDTSLCVIGGYGQLFFKNECQTVNLNTEIWKIKEPDKTILAPRYLSGLGVNSTLDTIYILGGYGSLTGDQKINPNNWYELIRHIPSSSKVERLFTYSDSQIDDFCFANSILIHGDSFYALAFSKFEYNNHLQLYKGSLTTNHLEPLGEKIPFTFHDIMTFVDLFYSNQEEKIYATVSFLNDEYQSDINIYSLNFPPKKVILPKKVAKANTHFVLWGFGGLLFISLFLLFLYTKRKKKLLSGELNASKLEADKQARNNVIQQNKEDLPGESSLNNNYSEISSENKKNRISLFGGFQIINNEGIDITGKFTPLLKELFLLIFLNSYGDKRGISSTNLREVLWSHKSDKDARNNRAVNMSRLKILISNVGDSTISKETGYWKVSIDYSKVNVDYDYLYNIVQLESPSQKQIFKLIDITRNNPFLKNISNEWLDPFKADISNDIVDTLINWAINNTDKYEPASIIPLTDAVFKFDPINEEAMELKCKSLVKLGKHSLAKSTYDSFVKEYELLYDEKYQKSFTEMID